MDTHTFVAFALRLSLCHLSTAVSQLAKLSMIEYVTFVTSAPEYPEPVTDSYTAVEEL
jgi:hypothetical protein